jgi:SAM-dependent methyltransferase
MSQPWWETFFTGVSVDLWLAAMPPEATRAEVDFIEKVLAPPLGGRLLDIACGGGRHGVELAARGYDVTGVDLAPEFLNAARANAAAANVRVRFEKRDMRDLPWSAHFDGAILFGNAFGYLDDAGNIASLEAAVRALKPGARLVINTGMVAESLMPHLQERGWYPVGDYHLLIANRYDQELGRLFTDYTFAHNGKFETRPGNQRVYMLNELIRMLQAAGCDEVRTYSSLAMEPYVLGSRMANIVARRATPQA